MNNPEAFAPPTRRLFGAVEFGHPSPQTGATRCRIFTRDGIIPAWGWNDPQQPRYGRVEVGCVHVMDIEWPGVDCAILEVDPRHDAPLYELLCDSLCPIPGVVTETVQLIEEISSAPLRAFLRRALLKPIALRGYWTAPGARRAHHAFKGGLAVHNLEIARMVASLPGLSQEDRDLGIAFAITHDYGKIYCYLQPGAAPTDSRTHEIVGRAKLADDLRLLAASDRNLAAKMDELLGGRRVKRNTPYPLAIGRVVRSFDQMSCEQDRNRLANESAQ
jgi:hypothetical protein